jgi:hypothetical protein
MRTALKGGLLLVLQAALLCALGSTGGSGSATALAEGGGGGENVPVKESRDMNAIAQTQRIRPYDANPFYWEYLGKPVVLLGGSVEDNLFQIPDIEAHLDLLASVGGNYVRCTMSSRDPGDVWPFERDAATGKYDLEKPGVEYWARFERFLKLTNERGIILQIELWDRFDFAREPWQDNPYNPRNNVNYTVEQSGLVEQIRTHPGRKESAFFRSVPTRENNQLVLKYQHAQVDRMLSVSLQYGNVLYCMDNETNESPEWGKYWSEYVQAKAKEAGVVVETTEMWDAHDLHDPQHANTFEHPETYSFVDISQNNHNSGAQHWENLLDMRKRIIETGKIRPMNTVKIYGANSGFYGTSRDAQERFWRNILGGIAATRFHRPPAGLGLSERPLKHIRSMRMMLEEVNILACEPHNDLLRSHSPNEAFCAAEPGAQYAVFFCDGGDSYLNVSACGDKPLSLRWLDIMDSRWLPAQQLPGGTGEVRLITPRDDGYWVAVVLTASRED